MKGQFSGGEMAGRALIAAGANSGIGCFPCAAPLALGYRESRIEISPVGACVWQAEYLETCLLSPCEVTDQDRIDPAGQHVIPSRARTVLLGTKDCLAMVCTRGYGPNNKFLVT